MKQIVIPTNITTKQVAPTDLNKTNFVINQVQTNTANALKPLLSNPLATGAKILQDVSLTAGVPNVINHQLGQTLNGWTMSRAQTFTMLSEDPNQPNLETQIVLWTYLDAVIDLLVW